MKRTLAIASFILLAVSGCNCNNDEGTNSATGTLDIDKAGTGLDFGMVRIREAKRVKLIMFNRGLAKMKILGIDRVDLSSDFLVSQPPNEIAPDGTGELTVSFSPETVGLAGGKIVVRTDSSTTPEVSVELKGQGVETKLTISDDIDFGLVEVQSRATSEIRIVNDGVIRELIKVTTGESQHFKVGPLPGAEGDIIPLDPGGVALIPVAFSPQFADRAGFASSVEVLACETCEPRLVSLRGTGVEAFLDVQPKTCLDFGLVNPGSELVKNVTVTNVGTRGLNLLEGGVATGTTEFTATTPTGPIVAGQTVTIPVRYKPTELGSDRGRLLLTTDDPKAASIEVCLEGAGGGPDIGVQPRNIDFGTVAVGVPRARPLRINNAGIAAGTENVDLVVTGIALKSGSTTSEFRTDFDAAHFPPIHRGTSGLVNVTYNPTADGEDADILVISTNDTDTPTFEVPLTGKGRALEPCVLSMVPANGTLDFGNAERGREVSLRFALRNTGSSDCIVDSMEVTGLSDAAFRLGAGPVAEAVIPAGQTASYLVNFKPVEARAHKGTVAFNVSDPVTPNRKVELKGTSIKGCLLIAPSDVDFGTVGANCASREKIVNVYNTCTTATKIQSIDLAVADVQVFEAFGLPAAFPVNLTGSNSATFKLRYRPVANGNDYGGVFLKSDERPEPYLISLVGRAADDAMQRDAFLQENKPRVDLLFVVDNSGSMGEEQAALAQNFSAFMKFAIQQQVDYRIAVTSTDVTTSGEHGRFVPLTSPNRIITPLTPNVESVFATNVNTGTNGSSDEQGLEAAYLALSAPNITGPNANFLRDDARLSVIIISDERDYSPKSLDFYYNFFISIKGARRSNLFSLSGVFDPSEESASPRYTDSAKRSGGIVSSITTTNWAKDLEKLGAIAFGYKTRFFLTSTPANAAGIEVKIDGVPVPAKDAFPSTITNWTFDPLSNSIDFNLISVPEPGSTLTINYVVACLQ